MKKFLLSLSIIAIFAAFLYPRKVTHAVFFETYPTHSIMYINGKPKKIKVSNLGLNKYTVVNFRYNIFGVHNIKEVKPLTNRIMIKKNDYYDLEAIGDKSLSSKPVYYKIDKNNTIHIASSKDIIIGKNNVQSFIDMNKLQTFIIYPLNYSDTRVAISDTSFQSIYHNSIKISCTSSSNLYTLINKFSLDVPANSTITFTSHKNELSINIGSKKKTFKERIYLKGGPFTITNITRGYPSFSPTYNGILELYPTKNGIILINEVNIEDYLTKVVPSEMPIWGGLEALKCQAVSARTYAISDMLGNRYANLGFYVDDSTKSQVYNNTKPEEVSNQAVKETSGLIMTFNNQPIDAKYYSTSCGTGVNYKDIWFTADGNSDYKPYLKTSSYLEDMLPLPSSEEDWFKFYKDINIKSFDSKSPYFRWNVSFDNKILTENLNINLKKVFKASPEYITLYTNTDKPKKLNKFPKELKNLKDIKVIKRSNGGNLLELSFTFENAVVDLKKDSYIRRSFNNSSNTEKIYINRHIGKPIENWSTLPSSFFSIEKNDGKFILYGGGYGHGVGMSQYGAMYLSENKQNFKTILNTYYNNVKIEKIY